MKKILIVEKDQKIALSLAGRLKAEGYETVIAYDAMSGLATAIKNPPDLVLLDISMPTGNGFSVAERIEAIIPTRTPFIFLTASKEQGFRDKAKAMGAAAFFQKPSQSETLIPVIKNALREKAQNQAQNPVPACWEIDGRLGLG